ncbi:hypothetical protein [Glutamicibacter sp.]|uniref:hypothetical protein n=1 Tax=Glutamicibacter sp. TaxID=1931995 RepID=UPI0028BD983A|nr:hypothetical protein [Glutamicibacter sp.]
MGRELNARTLNICESSGSQRYRTKAIADKAAVRRGRQLKREVATYRCPHCGGWHLRSS